MGFGKFIKSLLAGSAANDNQVSEPVDYGGLMIEAAPLNEDGKYRTAGYISGELNGETKRVQFIRADIHADIQTAIDHSISKGQQIIDEQGPSLLERSNL
jgi:hypothetical protein